MQCKNAPAKNKNQIKRDFVCAPRTKTNSKSKSKTKSKTLSNGNNLLCALLIHLCRLLNLNFTFTTRFHQTLLGPKTSHSTDLLYQIYSLVSSHQSLVLREGRPRKARAKLSFHSQKFRFSLAAKFKYPWIFETRSLI